MSWGTDTEVAPACKEWGTDPYSNAVAWTRAVSSWRWQRREWWWQFSHRSRQGKRERKRRRLSFPAAALFKWTPQLLKKSHSLILCWEWALAAESPNVSNTTRREETGGNVHFQSSQSACRVTAGWKDLTSLAFLLLSEGMTVIRPPCYEEQWTRTSLND